MRPYWHTGLVYWSVTWPLHMYAVLHAQNWHSKNHRYPPIYPKGICFSKNNHRRLFTVGHWIHNCNYEVTPEDYGNTTKNTINQIYHIFHRSTSQPHLQILPLPLLLQQTQSENLQLRNIPSITVPYPRVEPVSKPLRVQTLHSAPTQLPRLQPSKSPSLDPYPNPWIKIYKIFKVTLDSQIQENTHVTPASSTPFTPIPAQLQTKFPHPSSTSPCNQPSLQLTTRFSHLK